MPTEDEIYEEAIRASQVDDEPETPTDSSITEPEAEAEESEPAAEGETGETQTEAEPSEEPEQFDPVAYTRFKQVNDERKTLKEQNEAYQRLLQEDAEIAAVLAKRQQVATATQPQNTGLEGLKAQLSQLDPDEMTDTEIALYESLNGVVGLLEQTTSTIGNYQQRAEAEEQAKTEREFTDTLGSLATESGVELTDEQRREVLTEAAYIEAGMLQFGKQPSTAEVTKRAFRAVIGAAPKSDTDAAKRAAEAKRAEEVRAAKARQASGQTRGSGSSTAGKSDVDDLKGSDALDRAYAQAYK